MSISKMFSIGIVAVFIFIFIYLFAGPLAGEPFNSKYWKMGEGFYQDVPPRSSMVSDLLRGNKLKAGMERSAVLSLLGEPSFTEANDDLYWIGTGYRCFMPDLDSSSWLRIRFENGVVSQTKILKDCGGHGFDSVKDL